MFKQAYGIIETLAPLHVGTTVGEGSGNLNQIFRDRFTKTGIIPGSSIRGRLRAEMRTWRLQIEAERKAFLQAELQTVIAQEQAQAEAENLSDPTENLVFLERLARQQNLTIPDNLQASAALHESTWYGRESQAGLPDSQTEARVKFEYASIAWLPIYAPNQPIVWVSCPKLLSRFKRIARLTAPVPKPYTKSRSLRGLTINGVEKVFFSFGFLTIECADDLSGWFPSESELPAIVVDDDDMPVLHDMALYRQSRVKLKDDEKRTDLEDKGFFNMEALPEGTILAFPIGIKPDRSEAETGEGTQWQPLGFDRPSSTADIYLGGLESIGYGHCELTLVGV
ncbi:MAG: RAMP superfamily CRISPR-associated protein [Cyanobacteria bacterium P01_H01_bin.121]